MLLGMTIAALLLAGMACGGDDDDGDGASGPTDLAPTSAGGTPVDSGEVLTPEQILEKDPSVTNREVLDWGWMFEKSGALSGFGDPAGDGILMAVEEINDAGGFQVGDTIYTINLIQHDTASDVNQTIALTQELVQDNGVKVIWGPASVGDPQSTQVTQAAKVIHMCPCPLRELTSLETEEDAQGDAHYAFMTIPAPSAFLPPGAVRTKADYPEFATFATICTNSETGKAFCDFFTDAYTDAGFEHVEEVLTPPGATDFNPFLTTIKESNPDIILNFLDAGPEQFTLLRQSWQLDVGKFYIGVALPYDLWESLVGGEGIRSKIVALGAAPRTEAEYTSEKSRAFFEDKYKPFRGGTLPPAAFAAVLTYDPVYMLIAAMQRAGSVDDTDAIVEALEQVHFNGVGEDDMYFDARHIMVAGNDACTAFEGSMTCQHFPPPQAEGTE
jgi:branched-chain amino acid transport system substrate-binding protein